VYPARIFDLARYTTANNCVNSKLLSQYMNFYKSQCKTTNHIIFIPF
jgi:hypothetical protein